PDDAARAAAAEIPEVAAHAARLRIAEGPDMLRPMGVLRGEIAKRARHLPIRTLLARAGPAIQAIKPVFMMSPLSVAAFLDPAAIAFDLLVIDEASQIEPVDALGAVARARQMVVVGDDRQMPPTRFFARLTGDDKEPQDDDTLATADVESILSLCTARGFPAQMLRWHYRSRHESLIAVSNRAFYENRLLVIPSPRARSPELGLSLVRVDGTFDAGGSGTNAVEAQAVAEAVLAHARAHPEETLGVAAFSIRQRDAILDAVEALRRAHPDTEPFFAAHPHEPFFVKNLENVQGDERDVILISVGYARAPDGSLAMRFGPLSAEGGERRLNVLITRAKKRCVVFSGLTADDIDLSRASGRGVAVLKEFLAFAAGGTVAAAEAMGEDDVALTDAIAAALEDAGLAVARRVGLAGLFVDVAVKDDDGYRLGVLTDGAFYAAARSARDRDRLQEAALARMGWRLARSWAADWLVRPEAEARRLTALAGVAVQEQTGATPPPHPHGLATPYAPAAVEVPKDTPPEAMPFARLAGIAAAIVRAEAPIHTEAVIARAAALWGLAEPNAKQRAAIAQALRLARELDGLVVEGEFWRAEDSAIVPRDRAALPAAWRRADWLPPAEIRAALLAALE
ncbi:helicase, partial [Elioraea sp. Yellowstone]|uniref:AAA domain-containing protein n=1 Tax=Elioraea sp. Yellowstone TaxID=2592070 RepID=UPI00116E4ED5